MDLVFYGNTVTNNNYYNWYLWLTLFGNEDEIDPTKTIWFSLMKQRLGSFFVPDEDQLI